MSFVLDAVGEVTLKRGAVSVQGDHLPLLAGQPAGHFLGARTVPDWQHSFAQSRPNLANSWQFLPLRPPSPVAVRHSSPHCLPN